MPPAKSQSCFSTRSVNLSVNSTQRATVSRENRGISMEYSPSTISLKYLNFLYPVTCSTTSTAPSPTFASLHEGKVFSCLLYTSDAADDLLCVDLGGRRIIKKKKKKKN